MQSFEAVDSAGRTYKVSVTGSTISSSSRGGSYESRGMQQLHVEDGRPVNFIEDGVYEIAGRPPLRLTSTDPNRVRE